MLISIWIIPMFFFTIILMFLVALLLEKREEIKRNRELEEVSKRIHFRKSIYNLEV